VGIRLGPDISSDCRGGLILRILVLGRDVRCGRPVSGFCRVPRRSLPCESVAVPQSVSSAPVTTASSNTGCRPLPPAGGVVVGPLFPASAAGMPQRDRPATPAAPENAAGWRSPAPAGVRAGSRPGRRAPAGRRCGRGRSAARPRRKRRDELRAGGFHRSRHRLRDHPRHHGRRVDADQDPAFTEEDL
jgi:hypothetical protein